MMMQSDDEAKSEKTSLDALNEKIVAMDHERQEDAAAPSDISSAHKAMHVATELLVAVGVGGAAGYWLDRWLDTSPILFITCFFFGFAAGVKSMLRNLDTL